MPLYTCITTANTLAEDTKAALAAEITTIHSSITDASPSEPLLITGVIRAGRADTDKVRLAKDISSSSSRIAGIPQDRILVNIADGPAQFVVEGGRVMPEPGAEDDWLAEATR
jgi:phenylpyruvate tautomerase PptA (4-oxalocrotonate tautomerase family)